MITSLTREKYLQVVGLMALAQQHMAQLNYIEAAIKDVLEVVPTDEGRMGTGDPQHIADAIYGNYSVSKLLERIGLTAPRPGDTWKDADA